MPLVVKFAWIPALLTVLVWVGVNFASAPPPEDVSNRLIVGFGDAIASMIISIEAWGATLLIWLVYFVVFAFIR